MSEQLLNQMLEVLNQVNTRLDGIESRMERIESEVKIIKSEVSDIKADTSDIPLIRRASLETLDEVKESNKKTAATLNTHEFGIDILNREQLKIKTDIEKLKNR